MTIQAQSRRAAYNLCRSPYTWPGGYPLYAVMNDGGTLCHKCVKSERRLIYGTDGRDGWCVHCTDVNWEDSDLRCDHCGARIESAYGDD